MGTSPAEAQVREQRGELKMQTRLGLQQSHSQGGEEQQPRGQPLALDALAGMWGSRSFGEPKESLRGRRGL